MTEAYEKFCDHFENSMDCEIYSVKELHEQMLEFNKNGYSLNSFRVKLKSRYKESLDRFMRQLVRSEVKNISISQCIVQAARPRTVIASILFGLGVQLEKTFGSKWLVNHLSKLGFSITADEVLRFKQSAVQNMHTVYEEQTQDPQATQDQVFAQWVADNVDHNTATLSGKGTFIP